LQKKLRINNFIRVSEVRLVDEEGKQLGIVPIAEALRMAHERDLDLVEVGPTVQPPIAKILDFGKFMYQKEKQEKQSGGRHKEHETKTVRVGYKTGDHDLAFKAEKVDEFLGEGHSVKLELTLRGREKALAHLGKEKLLKFMGRIQTPFTAQGQPLRSPYGWVLMVQKEKKNVQKHENKKSVVQANPDNRQQKDPEAPAASESL